MCSLSTFNFYQSSWKTLDSAHIYLIFSTLFPALLIISSTRWKHISKRRCPHLLTAELAAFCWQMSLLATIEHNTVYRNLNLGGLLKLAFLIVTWKKKIPLKHVTLSLLPLLKGTTWFWGVVPSASETCHSLNVLTGHSNTGWGDHNRARSCPQLMSTMEPSDRGHWTVIRNMNHVGFSLP